MAAAETAGDADAQKRERVKARWAMLRQALLGSPLADDDGDGGRGGDENDADADRRIHDHSMNSFAGFHVLDRAILSYRDDRNAHGCVNAFAVLQGSDANHWDIVNNSYKSTNGYDVSFLTREAKARTQSNGTRQPQSSIQRRVEALLSHRNHGVDNTGNVRVWDAEGTLAGFCLSVILDGGDGNVNSEKSMQLLELREKLRFILFQESSASNDKQGASSCNANLLELGAGQAGLAGLAIAAASASLKNCVGANGGLNEAAHMKSLQVVLTDGHPTCVENNSTCARMMAKDDEGIDGRIETKLLLWDSNEKGAEACCQINNLVGDTHAPDGAQYHLCLASDCVHFQEFHDGLLNTIARTLAIDGIALLCQPERDPSLRNFMTLVGAVNAGGAIDNEPMESAKQVSEETEARRGSLFEMTLFEDFNAKVSKMHNRLLLEANKATTRYDPNRHRPLLLSLRKLRPYIEEVDGAIARDHVMKRNHND